MQYVEGLLVCVSISKENIFCQVDKRVCFSTIVDNQLIVVVSKALERLNLLLLCKDGPLGHSFEFRGMYLDFLTIDDML